MLKLKCAARPRCDAGQFCGFARSDIGFVFQRCSCYIGHDCVTNGLDELFPHTVNELFYNDTVYPARCTSFLNEY